jgi:hypothetical protein
MFLEGQWLADVLPITAACQQDLALAILVWDGDAAAVAGRNPWA